MGLKKKYHIDVEKIAGEGKEIKEKWKKPGNQASGYTKTLKCLLAVNWSCFTAWSQRLFRVF